MLADTNRDWSGGRPRPRLPLGLCRSHCMVLVQTRARDMSLMTWNNARFSLALGNGTSKLPISTWCHISMDVLTMTDVVMWTRSGGWRNPNYVSRNNACQSRSYTQYY